MAKKLKADQPKEMNHFIHQIGQIVKSYREKEGMSQMELSAILGFGNPMFVSLVERGKSKLPVSMMGKLIVILGIPESEVVKLSIAAYQHDLQAGVLRGKQMASKIKKIG